MQWIRSQFVADEVWFVDARNAAKPRLLQPEKQELVAKVRFPS
jgi:hypothetical protein